MAKHSGSPSSSAAAHDPRKFTAADEPMTPAQRSELGRLARAAGEDFDPEVSLTKAEAELEIEELLRAAKRGQGGGTVED